MGFGTAWKSFWRAWFNREFSTQVKALLAGAPAAAPPAAAPAVTKPAPMRSEALTLLSVLQREGRLVDFLKEPIASYDDAQIGAAVRDIHRDCAAALDRMFALKPLLDQSDGSMVEVPAGFDAAKYRLTGNVAGNPPHRGTLRHPGWVATKNELPTWTGQPASANVVAPAEVEI